MRRYQKTSLTLGDWPRLQFNVPSTIIISEVTFGSIGRRIDMNNLQYPLRLAGASIKERSDTFSVDGVLPLSHTHRQQSQEEFMGLLFYISGGRHRISMRTCEKERP